MYKISKVDRISILYLVDETNFHLKLLITFIKIRSLVTTL